MTLRPMAHALLSTILLAGCYASAEEVETGEIAEALEMENGGLTLEDELPAFGIADELAEIEVLAEDPLFEDTMSTDAEVLAITSAPDAVRYRVAVSWGQIPGDATNDTARDWSGILAVNRGALLVRRTLAFEPRTDHLLPRTDRRAVAFTSATLPHHDGLVLEIVDPDPGAAEPILLGYSGDLPGPLGSEAGRLAVPLRALLDGPVELASDDAGNRMVAVALARPIDPCAHGFLMGRWHRVADGRGRFVGRVVDEDGALRGHVRGIYGVRASGEQVFFGKYIAVDGTFRGIFRGGYDEGRFAGRWLSRSGDVGVLGGHYREAIPGPETGGHFVGRWAETSCGMEL